MVESRVAALVFILGVRKLKEMRFWLDVIDNAMNRSQHSSYSGLSAELGRNVCYFQHPFPSIRGRSWRCGVWNPLVYFSRCLAPSWQPYTSPSPNDLRLLHNVDVDDTIQLAHLMTGCCQPWASEFGQGTIHEKAKRNNLISKTKTRKAKKQKTNCFLDAGFACLSNYANRDGVEEIQT